MLESNYINSNVSRAPSSPYWEASGYLNEPALVPTNVKLPTQRP